MDDLEEEDEKSMVKKSDDNESDGLLNYDMDKDDEEEFANAMCNVERSLLPKVLVTLENASGFVQKILNIIKNGSITKYKEQLSSLQKGKTML